MKNLKTLSALFVALLLSLASDCQDMRTNAASDPKPPQSVPAFPGAEGFGASSLGGRRGRVIEVTNLNDSGPGSLRACLAASGPRICVFKTGGTIEVKSPLRISNPYITVAGQTAPGGGITLRNSPDATVDATLSVATHDVVVRYLSIRRGPGGAGDALEIAAPGVDRVYNVIIDHCSISWAVDENASTWYAPYNCSIQWSIVSEALDCSTHPKGCHSKGFIIGSYASDERKNKPGGHDISFHHNLLAHNGERNPLVKTAGLADIVNNVAYNPLGTFCHVDMENQLVKVLANFVGNYFRSGPDTDEKHGIATVAETPIGAGIYIDGNVIEYRNGMEMTGIHVVEPDSRWYLVKDRFPAAPVTTVSAREAYTLVLADAGSNRGLNCDGSFFWRRDAIDDRIVRDVKNKTGRIIDNPSQVGGWLKIDPGTPCADTDHDGMPDVWERMYGLNPDDGSDNILDADDDGYTNVEEYLNGTNPLEK